MKKIFLLFVFGMFLCLASNSWAVSYTGFISNDTGTIIATDGWSDDDGSIEGVNGRSSMLSWTVESNTDETEWTYDYLFQVDEKELSHIIIELSEVDGDYPGEILDGTTDDTDESTEEVEGPKTFSPDSSNPGMPGDLFGYKWGTSGDPLSYEFTFVTDRAPMWGDFYAKDGTGPDNTTGESIEVYAYNKFFGIDTEEAIGNGNAGGYVLVPDTNGGGGGQEIPEPTTMLLLGTGLLGCGIFFRRRLS